MEIFMSKQFIIPQSGKYYYLDLGHLCVDRIKVTEVNNSIIKIEFNDGEITKYSIKEFNFLMDKNKNIK